MTTRIMKPDRLRLLAIAVAYGRVGYVFLIRDELKDWHMSKKASLSPKVARAKAAQWIAYLEPNVVVTENVGMASRKSPKTIRRIHAIARIAKAADLVDVIVIRRQEFKNKYEEADHLIQRFPQLKAWRPKKRKMWMPEPRNTIYFEALSIALTAKEGFEANSASKLPDRSKFSKGQEL